MIIDKTEIEKGYFQLIKQKMATIVDGYYIDDDKLMFVVPPSNKCKWDSETKTWIDLTTKNEQLEYYKNEILKNTRELLVYETAGFHNDELERKNQNLIEKHRILSEEIARAEDKKY